MEAVAYLAGEPHTDHPACACPVLTAYGVRLNDAMGEGPVGDHLRDRYLRDLAALLVGTRADPETQRRRAYILADGAVRAIAPIALDAAGLADSATRLRSLPPVVCASSAAATAAAAAKAAWAAAGAADGAVWAEARALFLRAIGTP